jgi:tetratricopeptide (TPR) repeat protein
MLLTLLALLVLQQPETMSLLEKPLFAPPLSRDERGKREDALRAARTAIDRDGSSVDAVLAFARAQMSLGRVGDSLETLTRALEGKPDDPRLLLERGRGLIVIRKFEIGARELKKASETIPEAHCTLGVAEYLAADYPHAREAFAKCTDPGAVSVFPYLADWRTGPSAMPRPSVARDAVPDPTVIRLPGAATKPAPATRLPLTATYLDAAEHLLKGRTKEARDLLKQIVEKDRDEWMDPVYIAAEVDYAKLLKADGKKKLKIED